MAEGSDQFNGRMGLIFASIGAAIGTGNILAFPANGWSERGWNVLGSVAVFLVHLVNTSGYC